MKELDLYMYIQFKQISSYVSWLVVSCCCLLWFPSVSWCSA